MLAATRTISRRAINPALLRSYAIDSKPTAGLNAKPLSTPSTPLSHPAAPSTTSPTSPPPGTHTPSTPTSAPLDPDALAADPVKAEVPAAAQPSLASQFLEIADLPGQGGNQDSATGKRTGARAAGTEKSSIEKKKAGIARLMTALGLGLVAGGGFYLGRPWDSEEEKMKLVGRSDDTDAVREAEQEGWLGWVGRIKIRGADQMDYLNKPAWDPLLPAPLPEPYFRPYTLVIDLDDMLIHSAWSTEHGWRTAKRPGVDYFLAYLSQFYEIVLFTTQPAYTAAPIVEKIDQYGAYIPWKLFRESTRYKNKGLIKDLSYLGRPLERTIILDTNPDHTQLQPDNAILLQPWHGSRGDDTAKELVALIPFLEALAIRGVKDVRPLIKYYEGKHIPTAYAEAERRVKQDLLDKWEQDKAASQGAVGWVKAALGSLVKSPSKDVPPETDIEKVRKNAQRMYLEEQKYWKDNEATIKKQMEDDRERQLKEMKSSVLGMMGLAGPPSQAPSS